MNNRVRLALVAHGGVRGDSCYRFCWPGVGTANAECYRRLARPDDSSPGIERSSCVLMLKRNLRYTASGLAHHCQAQTGWLISRR